MILLRLFQNLDTLILLKDGKIELKASWDESMKANLAAIKSVITIFRGVVQEINKLQYHMLGTNRKRLIGLPDPDFIGNPYSNTQLTLINSSTYVEYGEGANINFNDLNALAQCFHKTYATVIRTDINLVQPQAPGGIIKTVATESSTLKLRYKRISFYEEMDKYSKFIYELKQQYRTRLDKATIITIFKEEFKGENMTKENAEIIVDATLSKKIKHPGIDVRVRKSEDNENLYKIFILGAKNLLQLSQVHFYIKQLLYVFKNRGTATVTEFLTNWNKNGECTVDIQSLKMDNDEIAFKTVLDAAKQITEQANTSELGESEVDALDLLDNPDLWGYEEAVDIEPTGLAEEEETEPEIATEQEEAEIGSQTSGPLGPGIEAAPISKKKKPTHEGMVTPLARLEKTDPELFPTGYATGCQKSDFRQPMVITKKRRNDMVNEFKKEENKLNEELGSGKSTEAKKQQLRNIRMKLQLLDDTHGLPCRNNTFYFCPIAFCYTCETAFDAG